MNTTIPAALLLLVDAAPRPCSRVADPNLFHPPVETDAATRPARVICAGCPVRITCATVACMTGDTGVWGGTDTGERRELAHARRRVTPTREAVAV